MTEECSERNPVEVLAEEYIRRRRNGEHPTLNEYAERFPDWASEIQEVFPTLLMLENLKPTGDELDPPQEHLPVDNLGDYRILQEIGRGGMGVVYEALQESLDRHVALKVLYGRALNNPRRLRRFEREAQTAAKLHHTNIVPVFGVGEQDGMHYYVMQLISGQGLDRILSALRGDPIPLPSTQSFRSSAADAELSNASDSHSLSPVRLAHSLVSGQSELLTEAHLATESNGSLADVHQQDAAVEQLLDVSDISDHDAARLLHAQGPSVTKLDHVYWQNVTSIGIQVAEALRYAHEQDVLHRDIKPANLLLNGQGTVWITDFGLAKLVEDNSLTHSGDIVGTLSYMAPEQFDGVSDQRSDIYSLGLTLYELVTLKPAFDDTDRRRLIKQVTQNTPVQPRKINPAIPVDLETVILKAIRREPQGRYQTAQELALDLRRVQEDRPIRARRVSMAERTWRWCRRNPTVASLASVILLLLMLLCTLTSVAYHNTNAALARESLARRNAEAERLRAEEERVRAEGAVGLAAEVLEVVFRQAAPSGFEQGIDAQIDEAEPIAEFDPVVTSDNAALLQGLLAFYDSLARLNNQTPKLQLQAGEAHRKVGDIQSRLGKFNLAETAYRRAITVFQKLAITNPTESRYDQQTAQAYNALGELMHRRRRYAAAVSAQQAALAIYQKRLQNDNPNPEDRLHLALTLNQIGRSLARDRELKDAEVQMHSALLELDTLRSLDSLNSDYQHAEARIYRSLVPVLYAQQKTNEGQTAFSTCLRLLDELVEDYPYRAIYSYDLVLTIGMLPTRQTQPDHVAERASQFERSVSLSRKLTERFPQVPEYRIALSNSHSKLGRFLESQDQLADAVEHYQQAFDLQQKLLSDFPEVLKYYFASAVAAQRLGNALARSGELAQARLALETAVDNQSLYLRSESDSLFSKGYLYQHYRTLAEVLALLGESSLSREAEERSAEIRDEWRQQLRSREERNRTPNSARSRSTNTGT